MILINLKMQIRPEKMGDWLALEFWLVRTGGGCEIRTREGLHPTRFPSLWG